MAHRDWSEFELSFCSQGWCLHRKNPPVNGRMCPLHVHPSKLSIRKYRQVLRMASTSLISQGLAIAEAHVTETAQGARKWFIHFPGNDYMKHSARLTVQCKVPNSQARSLWTPGRSSNKPSGFGNFSCTWNIVYTCIFLPVGKVFQRIFKTNHDVFPKD